MVPIWMVAKYVFYFFVPWYANESNNINSIWKSNNNIQQKIMNLIETTNYLKVLAVHTVYA